MLTEAIKLVLTKEEQELYLQTLEEYDEIMSNQDMIDLMNYSPSNTDSPTDDAEILRRAGELSTHPGYSEMVTEAFRLIK